MTLSEAIKKILTEHGKPLHVREIRDIVKERNLARLGGKTPEATISSTMITNPKLFKRVGPNMYTLKDSPSQPQSKTENMTLLEQAGLQEYKYVEKVFVKKTVRYVEGIREHARFFFFREKDRGDVVDAKIDKASSLLYILLNLKERKIYVGETDKGITRMVYSKQEKEQKNQMLTTHIAIIDGSDDLTSSNIRKNLEAQLIEAFEAKQWKVVNEQKVKPSLTKNEDMEFDNLSEEVKFLTDKLYSLMS